MTPPSHRDEDRNVDLMREGINVVREDEAHVPAPESLNAESLGPDVAAGRLGNRHEHRVGRGDKAP